MNWREHCPIDEEEWPVRRQAWHAGWKCRMENGSTDAARLEPLFQNVMEEYNRKILSVWADGYSAADNLTG